MRFTQIAHGQSAPLAISRGFQRPCNDIQVQTHDMLGIQMVVALEVDPQLLSNVFRDDSIWRPSQPCLDAVQGWLVKQLGLGRKLLDSCPQPIADVWAQLLELVRLAAVG